MTGIDPSSFLRVDANGVARIRLPGGRWAALELTEVDGVVHPAASATDIVDEAPPHPGTVARDYVNARVAEMKQRDRPGSEAETRELVDDLELGVWRAGRDPHMEHVGLDEIWRAVWLRGRARNTVAIAVRNVVDDVTVDALPKEKRKKGDPVRITSREVQDAVAALTADMGSCWPVIRRKLDPLDDDKADLDRRAKEALMGLGGVANPELAKAGSKAAKAYANKRRAGPGAWPDPVPLARMVAGALWAAKTGSRIEDARSHGPSLPRLMISSFAALPNGSQKDCFRPAEIIQDGTGKHVATFVPSPAMLVFNPRLSDSLDWHKTVRFVVSTTHDQRYVRDDPKPNEIWIEGGYSELAERLKISGGEGRTKLKTVISAMEHTRVRVEDIGGGRIDAPILVTEDYRRNKTHHLKLTALGPLAPGWLTDWYKKLRRADRVLTPVPLPSRWPAFVGRPNDWGAQASMQNLVFREIRDCAVFFWSNDQTVEISEATFGRLADEAGLPHHMLNRVLAAWHIGDKVSPPFLVRVDGGDPSGVGGHYGLGPEYWVEARTIYEAGRRMARGAENGKLAAAIRRGH